MNWIRLFVLDILLIFAATPYGVADDAPFVFRFGSVLGSEGAHWVYGISKITEEGLPFWHESSLLPVTSRINQINRADTVQELRFVHNIYQEIAQEQKNRAVFTSDFLEGLKAEDTELPPERLFHYVIKSKQSGQTLAVFGVFDGTMQASFSDHLLPIERKLKKKDLKLNARHDSSRKIIEIRRLAKVASQRLVDMEQIAKIISQHLAYSGLADATIYVHTDEFGARLYRKLGFEIELDPERLQAPHEYVLRIEASRFIERNPPKGFLKVVSKPAAVSCASLFTDLTTRP